MKAEERFHQGRKHKNICFSEPELELIHLLGARAGAKFPGWQEFGAGVGAVGGSHELVTWPPPLLHFQQQIGLGVTVQLRLPGQEIQIRHAAILGLVKLY